MATQVTETDSLKKQSITTAFQILRKIGLRHSLASFSFVDRAQRLVSGADAGACW